MSLFFVQECYSLKRKTKPKLQYLRFVLDGLTAILLKLDSI